MGRGGAGKGIGGVGHQQEAKSAIELKHVLSVYICVCLSVCFLQALPPINLNGTGDEYVSYSAMKMALSHCGR